MEVDYNYSCEDGFGGLSEKIRMDEIHQMCEGLSAVTDRTRDSYSIVFDYHFYSTCPFLSLSLAREEDRLHFQMCVYDICCDLQVDQFFTEEEWKPYLQEFLTWGEPLPFQLGDPVRTLNQITPELGVNKWGIVTEISPPTIFSEGWQAWVAYGDLDDKGDRILRGQWYNIDEIARAENMDDQKED